MENKKNYHEMSHSNLVSRRDFGKIDINFDEPDLLEMQRKSYNDFLENSLEKLIKSYFPIKHAKNNKYEVRYNGLSFAAPLKNEDECRNERKTYEKALYVDLSLINNETGEIKRVKKSTKSQANGLFFSNIPIMTKKGTFIINGIEKFVISQIVRAPGAYILNKSQIKLYNKKKVNNGYICEMLPSRGTLFNFIIDEPSQTVRFMVRNSTGDSAPSFPATILLKAFGMSQNDILKTFRDNLLIINTLGSETLSGKSKNTLNFDHQHITDDFEILGYRNQVENLRKQMQKANTQGSPIDSKLKQLVIGLEDTKKELKEISTQRNEILNEYNAANDELKKNSSDSKLKVKVESLYTKAYKIEEKKEKLEAILTKILDQIITEKAAKYLISELSISTRSIESNVSSKSNPICYQDVITAHFMEPKKYDLSSAGRYRILHKMHVSDRLYQRIIAEDIKDNNGKVILPKGTLMLKDEIEKFKKLISENKINVRYDIDLSTPSKSELKNKNTVECIEVYCSNDELNEKTPIIGEISESNDLKALSLTLADFICCISYTINLPYDIGSYDDIDHLGNKRLRLVGEQLQSKLQAGMARVEKHVKDKLASISIATANEEQKAKTNERTTVKTVVNTKTFQLVVKSFFNTNQLTQFVDQQNPLSELSNKRRLSAMGDGGISREDPNLDIRDIHYSHYGRICPIETPEGMNIGLIMSLASYTRIDPNGFLISPYHQVINGVIQKEVTWLTPLKEDQYAICDATVPHDENGKITAKKVMCRYRSNQQEFDVNQINYIDIAPCQVVSIAASAIPFLEHDDTTRALMGANMQRQAVPLIHPFAPIVGTGVEYKIAHDSGLTQIAKNDGVVENADSNQIVIKNKDGKLDKYKLVKYRKSNQDTCINQTPIVSVGQKIKANDTITDGPAMYNGELALGRNPLVAFTTWNGYNYEDAIVISERLVRDDVYTSISIEEHTVQCLRTKNGDEEITRDLNNVSEDAKRYLDEDGIIMVGAEVHEGDILVGKITPRGQSDFSPEERLLQAIFGGKSKNSYESSLKVPHGGEGIVCKVQRFSISNNDELDDDVIELVKVFIAQKCKIQIGDKMSGRHGNKGCISIVAPIADMPFMDDGTPIDICLSPLGVPSRMNIGQVLEINLGLSMRLLGQKKALEIALVSESNAAAEKTFVKEFGLPLQKAKVLVKSIKNYCKQNNVTSSAEAKNKISNNEIFLMVKNAGLDIEDINYKSSTPTFCGASVDDVINNLTEAGYSSKDRSKLGKFQLYDGKTGEPFDGLSTVGVMYMMKLDHMVDDKIHARAVGPYSKITQQPLGGKSQNGGQRFGEMEVWALEAYGAAHNLQEILTIKSDDVKGRNLTYSSIVRGRKMPKPGLPETFKLLTKQLQGLGLCMDALYEDGQSVDINSFSSVSDLSVESDQEKSKDNAAYANSSDVFEQNDEESEIF